MENIFRAAYAEIDLDNIAYNMKNIKSLVRTKEIMAIVKAASYGHGAVDVSKTLLENGATRLGIAVLSEGVELRKNNITAPIMILGFTPLYLGEDLIKYDIEQTVYDLNYAKELSNIALKFNTKTKIHIAIDTGMGRIGFLPNKQSLEEIKEISSLTGLEVVGIFTHFSSADQADKGYTNMQFSKFKNFNDKLYEMGIIIPLKHTSNSGAIIDSPETYLDCVRAGIILYGYYPSNEVNLKNLSLKPALTLKAKIVHIKELDEGMYISYNRTFKTKRKTKIATIPIGYADGYSRALSNKGKVIVNGQFAPVIGNVCMDQFMIDVTDCGNVNVNDEVILLGRDGDLKFDADDMAEMLNTINYEVLCMIKDRVPRVYIKNNKIVDTKFLHFSL